MSQKKTEQSDSSLPEGWQESFDPELKRSLDFAGQTVDPGLVDYSKVKMHQTSLKLSGDGTFYTLQGEGPTMGHPCVFVRLHVCNLKCTWCDAWYTWNPNTEEFWTEGRDVPIDDVAALIRQTWAGPDLRLKRVILTGGEPLIQRKQIDRLMDNLDYFKWQLEIETNGTLMPTETQLMWAQFNCSPKLNNSDNKNRIKPKVLKALDEVNTTFKFVTTSVADLDEIIKEFIEPGYISHHNAIIMPQGITEEEVSAMSKILAEPVKERGLRMMPRYQNICWDGARRGV